MDNIYKEPLYSIRIPKLAIENASQNEKPKAAIVRNCVLYYATSGSTPMPI